MKALEKKIMKLAELKPADYNPRKIDKESLKGLKNSIEEFGLLQPIIMNKTTGNIVGGHQRYHILAEIGEVETEVVIVDLSIEKEIALNIALNNPEIQGTWDDTILDVLNSVEGATAELFESLRLNDLRDKLKGGTFENDDEVNEIDNTLPAMPTEAISKKGDIWDLGGSLLMCGDGTNPEDVQKLFRSKKSNLLITSPDLFIVKEEEEGIIEEFIGKSVESCLKVMDENNSRIIVNSYSLRPRDENTKLVLVIDKWIRYFAQKNWKLRNIKNWMKGLNAFKNSMDDVCDSYTSSLLCFFKENAENRGQNISVKKWAKQVDWTIKWDANNSLPVEIPKRLMDLYSKEDEIIFDPFADTGSVIIAAVRCKRRCYALESDLKKADRIVKRWQNICFKLAKTLEGKSLEVDEFSDV